MAYYQSFELDISSFERYLSDFKTTLYAVQDELATPMIRLQSRRTFMIDKAIGHVGFTPLKKLLDNTTDDREGIGTDCIIDIAGNLCSDILSFAYKFSEPLEEEDLIIISSSDEDEDENKDENGDEDGDGDGDVDDDDD